MKNLLLIGIFTLSTGLLVGLDNTQDSYDTDYAQEKEKIKKAFTRKDILRLAEISSEEMAPSVYNGTCHIYLWDLMTHINNTIKSRLNLRNDISIDDRRVSSAARKIQKRILKIAYNKLNNTDPSQLDNFSKLVQECSRQHSLNEHSLREHGEVMQNCLELHGIKDASREFLPFENDMVKESYPDYIAQQKEKQAKATQSEPKTPFFFGS